MKRSRRCVVGVAAMVGSVMCAPALGQPVPIGASGAPAHAADLSDYVVRFREDQGSLGRFYQQPWDGERLDRLARFYDERKAALADLNFDGLDQAGKIDYVLLREEMEYERARVDVQRARLAEIGGMLPFREAVLALEHDLRLLKKADPEHAAAVLAEFPKQIKAVRERIEKGRAAKPEAKPAPTPEPVSGAVEKMPEKPAAAGAEGDKPAADLTRLPPPPLQPPPSVAAADAPIVITPVIAQRTAGAVSSLRGTLSGWFSFYDGFNPEFSWWCRKPYDEAVGAMDEFAKYLRETCAGIKGGDDDPLLGDPIGAAALDLDLKHEFMPYSPAQLIAIGEAEFAWCESEMRNASNQMGFGDDWHKALEKVKTLHVPPGEMDELVARQSREAIAFLKAHDLVTIPPLCEETWRLEMSPREVQRYLPFAAYNEQAMTIGYPTSGMSHDDKLMSMRGNNVHFSKLVTPHELIPGHHLQGYMARRIRPYRNLFSTPFFVEGWALYWEMTLYDEGYPESPEDRVGMLFWRMHRCARIIVSLKFHLGEMTPQQMIDFLVERVGHERLTATSEVRRFIGGDYSPLYQCGYMIGGKQIRALRGEAVGAGKLSEKEFHDTLLTYGAIPIELVRAGVLNLPLRRDSGREWRFAGTDPAAGK